MQAIILAAGRGSRLAPLTDTVPKPMLEILGMPILERIILDLPDEIDEVIIVVKHLKDIIEAHFGNSYKGKSILYVQQGDMNGTYGAVLSTKKHLRKGSFMVLGGDDIVSKEELALMIKQSLSAGYNIKPVPSLDYEVFNILNGKVMGLVKVKEEESEIPKFFPTGTYVLDERLWECEPVCFKGDEYGLPHTLVALFKKEEVWGVEMKSWIQINSHEEFVHAEKEVSLRLNNIDFRKIHIIGIGGIGISALARYYNALGCSVSGSDTQESDLLNSLRNEGIDIHIGNDASNIFKNIDLCIYTIAINKDSDKEYIETSLRKSGGENITLLSYPEALAQISKEKKVIAVCGTHGKTTTTAMAQKAFSQAGLSVTMILGSLIEVGGKMTNYIHGESDWMLIEACEYKRSFLNYDPEIVLVTNIDADHLDYYKDINDIINAFQEFVKKIPRSGKLLVHTNEYNILESSEKINVDEGVDETLVSLSVPGQHNRKNAQLVIMAGKVLGLDDEAVRIGLHSFTGTWRRQEYRGRHFGMECYDDYAHHPSEVSATLEAFREKYPDKKIIICFMPHLYSRTKLLLDDFSHSFELADQIVILPIYAAREDFDPSINSQMLADKIAENGKKVCTTNGIDETKDFLNNISSTDSIVVTMGAGDIYKIYE